jgi:hypothetical protein
MAAAEIRASRAKVVAHMLDMEILQNQSSTEQARHATIVF